MARKHLLYLSGVIVLALLLTAACRGRALDYPLVWDDDHVLKPSAKFSGQGFAAAFRIFDPEYWLRGRGPSRRPYRPIRDVAFLLAHRLSEGRPPAYHLVNIVTHALNALIVLWLAWLLLRNVYAAGVASLLFSAHPVHTEAVVWAKNCAEPLALFFGLLAACLFVLWARKSRKGTRCRGLLLVGATGAFVATLLAKESAVCLPVILFLWCLMLPGRKNRRRGVLAVVPMLLIAVLYAVPAFRAVTAGEPKAFARKSSDLPPGRRIELVGRTITAYARAIFVPSGPSPWRDLKIPRQASALLVGAFVLAALLLLGQLADMLLRKKRPAFGLWWMLAALGPASNLLAYNARRPVADQRAYLPSVGYALLIGGICAAILRSRRDVRVRVGVFVSCGLLVAALAAISFQSTPVWRHRLALWRQTVRQSPGMGRASYNLGVAYARQSFDAGAITLYKHAWPHEESPKVEICLNLGASLSRRGRLREAASYYQRAARLDPTNEMAHIGLGGVCAELGQYEEAERHTQRALGLRPYWAQAAINMGAYAERSQRKNKYEVALDWYRKAILYDQRSAQAHANIGRVLYEQGDASGALFQLNKALRWSGPVGRIAVHRDMGSICAEQGRHDLAVPHFQAALELGDSGWRTAMMLAESYAGMGEFGKAAEARRQALTRMRQMTSSE